ncbi:CHAD domain-containing protein [Rhizobium albus]|nr:CHAD domain-containing protein [Rhizobium albus]
MPYRLTPKDKSFQQSVRRIAGEQLARAIEEARAVPPNPDADPEAGGAATVTEGLTERQRVHQLRKRIKKVRGLIRMVRPAFSDYAKENAALRDVGRSLAPHREAQSLIAAFDDLVAAYRSDTALPPLRSQSVTALRRRLVVPLSEETGAAAPVIEAAATELAAIAERARSWKIRPKGAKAFAEGLADTHRAARKARVHAVKTLAAIDTDPASPQAAETRWHAAEALHEWRKRVKAHAQHLRILAPVWPEAIDPQVAAARALAEDLGRHHDLAELVRAIGQDDLGHHPTRVALIDLAYARQAAIEATALAAGARILAEKSKPMAARHQALYKLWQAEDRKAAPGKTGDPLPASPPFVKGWFAAKPNGGNSGNGDADS